VEERVKDNREPEYGAAPMQCEATRLMLAVKQGDARAFDELVESLRGRAFHVARSLVGSRDDAMDLAQETFLKVYRARDTFRDGEPFLPWFHRILRNTCFSFLRDRRRLRERSVSSHAAGAEDDEGDYEILALRHFKELSYRDIAAALGVPEGTVMSRLFHARRRLRERLDTELLAEITGERATADSTRGEPAVRAADKERTR